MKTFGNSHHQESTLTVAELREILKNYPNDMPVLATWEGIYTSFRGCEHLDPRNGETDDYVYVETPEKGYFPFDELKEPCLIFEVDQW